MAPGGCSAGTDWAASSALGLKAFRRPPRASSHRPELPRGTEPARGAWPEDGEAAERKVQWQGIYL